MLLPHDSGWSFYRAKLLLKTHEFIPWEVSVTGPFDQWPTGEGFERFYGVHNDGLEANVRYTPGSGPGVWIPTPPAFAAAATPWLGQMRPFSMNTAADFRPDGPTPLAPAQTSAT
jgi:hypothetical protein